MIEFKNVTKEFKDKVVLSDISMEIEDKRLTVLIGPSGCGKTTTLKMINRLIHPTAGDIFIDGENIDELDPVKAAAQDGVRHTAGRPVSSYDYKTEHRDHREA